MTKIMGIRLIADEGRILRNVESGATGYVVSTTEEKEKEWEEIEDVTEVESLESLETLES